MGSSGRVMLRDAASHPTASSNSGRVLVRDAANPLLYRIGVCQAADPPSHEVDDETLPNGDIR